MTATANPPPAAPAATPVAPAATPAAGEAAEGHTQEYLTFCLGEEEYGVDILKVQEIRSYDTVTRLPAAPSYIKGVINLRGTIVPIVDMRLRFAMAEARYDEFTVMIVLSVAGRIVGLVVDGVSDVITLADTQIRPAPEMSSKALDGRFITGLGALEERLLILIDIEALISGEALGLVADAAAETH